MESQKRKVILTVVVAFFASVGNSGMIPTGRNYVEVNRAFHGLEEVLVNLEIVGEDTVLLTFQFSNASSLELVLENVQFNLYANREYLGNFDRRQKTMLKPGETIIVVEAKIHPHYLPKMQEQLASSKVNWFLYGGSVVELPFERRTFNLEISEGWVST